MYRLIDITKDEYEKLPTLNKNSSEAELKIFSNNELIKKYNNPEDSDLEKIEYLIFNYQNKLKTQVPLGPVYIGEEFCGTLLKYFPDAYHFNILKKINNTNIKINRLKILMNRLVELCKNNLYTTDLHSSNVLLTKDKLDVEIIDIDRNGIEISSSFNKDLYNYVTYEYNKLILEILFEEYNPILSTSSKRTSEILELYKIKNYYIDYIINRKTTFKFSKEFLEYIEKDKIILKN